MAFHLIDMETWERREHYKYYQTMVHSSYTLNAHIKITELLKEIKNRELRFYPVFLYVVSTAVNRIREMRMAHDSEHRLGYWDECHPSTPYFTRTTIHFQTYGPNITSTCRLYKPAFRTWNLRRQGVKPAENGNFTPISCVPWISYTSQCYDTR